MSTSNGKCKKPRRCLEYEPKKRTCLSHYPSMTKRKKLIEQKEQEIIHETIEPKKIYNYIVEEPEDMEFGNKKAIEYKPSNLQSTDDDVIYPSSRVKLTKYFDTGLTKKRQRRKLTKKQKKDEIAKVTRLMAELLVGYIIAMRSVENQETKEKIKSKMKTQQNRLRDLLVEYYKYYPEIMDDLKYYPIMNLSN